MPQQTNTPKYLSSFVTLLVVLSCSTPRTELPEAAPEDNGIAASNQDALKIELGKRLFHDATLSEPSGTSCASCHDPKRAFVGHNDSSEPAVAQGSRPGELGPRNTPTLTYLSFSPEFHFEKEEEVTSDGITEISYVPTGGFFWDGRAQTLEEQAKSPFLAAHEMNNKDVPSLVTKVAAGEYSELFKEVYGTNAFDDSSRAFDLIADAIAAFEKSSTFHPFNSKFDAYLRGEVELTAQEEEGFQLFLAPEKGNCLACHVGDTDSRDPRDWLFTDFTYDNLGFPRNPAIPATHDTAYFDLGLCRQEGLLNSIPEGFETDTLCGAFKVPTLRNSAVTAPYGHNGVFMGLRMVVLFYATRDTDPTRWYTNNSNGTLNKFDDLPRNYVENVNLDEVPYGQKAGERPRLNDREIDALVAFLETLTDQEFSAKVRGLQ